MYTNRQHLLATSWAPILSANWLLLLRRLLLVLLLLLVLVVLRDYPLRGTRTTKKRDEEGSLRTFPLW